MYDTEWSKAYLESDGKGKKPEHECTLCINPTTLNELSETLKQYKLEIGEYILKSDGAHYIVVLDNGEEVQHEHLETAVMMLLRMVSEYTKNMDGQ
jgi:hypothetical protein